MTFKVQAYSTIMKRYKTISIHKDLESATNQADKSSNDFSIVGVITILKDNEIRLSKKGEVLSTNK